MASLGPVRGLRGEEDIDGLFEPALEQAGVAGEGDGGAGGGFRPQGHVEAVDGVEEEEGAHALVEVVAGAAEAVEGLAFGGELGERHAAAEGVQGLVARLAGRGDDADEPAHERLPTTSRSARSSRSWASTWARSCPLSARASWATRTP